MSKNFNFKYFILAALAIGIFVGTNPSEERHRKSYYKALKKSDSWSSKVLHATGKGSEFFDNIFGTGSIFVYKNYWLFSTLKINDDGDIDGGEPTVSVGALGLVINIF